MIGNKVQPIPHLDAPSSHGQPLPANLRHDMETSFGVDLSDVKVHVGHEATLLGAQSFSTRDEVFLAPAQEFLMRHEVMHVIQQRAVTAESSSGIAEGLVEVSQNGETE
jgi:hypothetical protein